MSTRSLPLVSVVIPCYNQARFLAEAIGSALEQTHAPLEVIVVDDGSTDDTARVAAGFASVACLRQRNRGAPAARNAGMRHARGALLLFLDADDRLLPDAVATGVEALQQHPEWAFVSGHVRAIASDGAPEGTPLQDHEGGNQFVALLRENYIWTPGAVLYRRTALDEIGAFEPSARASADYELNLRLARQRPVGCHHQVVLEYRRHGANMSGDAGEMLRSAVAVRQAQRRFVTGDRAAERAWRDGLEAVRTDYGNRLVRQVRRDLRTRGRRVRAVRGVIRLGRYYPAGLLRMLAGGVRAPASA